MATVNANTLEQTHHQEMRKSRTTLAEKTQTTLTIAQQRAQNSIYVKPYSSDERRERAEEERLFAAQDTSREAYALCRDAFHPLLSSAVHGEVEREKELCVLRGEVLQFENLLAQMLEIMQDQAKELNVCDILLEQYRATLPYLLERHNLLCEIEQLQRPIAAKRAP